MRQHLHGTTVTAPFLFHLHHPTGVRPGVLPRGEGGCHAQAKTGHHAALCHPSLEQGLCGQGHQQRESGGCIHQVAVQEHGHGEAHCEHAQQRHEAPERGEPQAGRTQAVLPAGGHNERQEGHGEHWCIAPSPQHVVEFLGHGRAEPGALTHALRDALQEDEGVGQECAHGHRCAKQEAAPQGAQLGQNEHQQPLESDHQPAEEVRVYKHHVEHGEG